MDEEKKDMTLDEDALDAVTGGADMPYGVLYRCPNCNCEQRTTPMRKINGSTNPFCICGTRMIKIDE